MRRRPIFSVSLVLALAAPASAAEESPPPPPAEDPAPPAAPDEVDWASAPPPDQASGVARDEAPSPADRLRVIPRAVLFVPRWVFWGIAQPVRAGAYVYERYDLPGWFRRIFFTVDGTFGIYPLADYDTNYGASLGARLVHRDLFGRGEQLKLRANVGGRYRQGYGASLRSGRRFGDRVALLIDGSFERRAKERFFGIGDADVSDLLPAMPLAPVVDGGVAADARFREQLVRTMATADVRLAGALGVRLSTAAMMRELAGTGEDDSVDQRYDTTRLVGWDDGVHTLELEAAVVYDSRRQPSRFMTQAVDATGWLAVAHAGAVRGLGGDPTRFERYGGELQRYFDLHHGTRVLAVRLLAETVAGTDGGADRRISFLDLPRLGGADFLRGYPGSRFRDRAVTLASVEYTWDLGNFIAAYTFVDVGRAWRSLVDVAPEHLRIGIGGGLQVHTGRSFIGRGQIAASRDGDVFVDVVLSPAFARRERVGRL